MCVHAEQTVTPIQRRDVTKLVQSQPWPRRTAQGDAERRLISPPHDAARHRLHLDRRRHDRMASRNTTSCDASRSAASRCAISESPPTSGRAMSLATSCRCSRRRGATLMPGRHACRVTDHRTSPKAPSPRSVAMGPPSTPPNPRRARIERSIQRFADIRDPDAAPTRPTRRPGSSRPWRPARRVHIDHPPRLPEWTAFATLSIGTVVCAVILIGDPGRLGRFGCARRP